MNDKDSIRLDKLLCKGQLRLAYNSIENVDIREKVVQQYAELLDANIHPDKSLYGHLRDAILPAIAIRKVLPNEGYSNGETCKIIRHSVLETALPMRRMFMAIGHMPFGFAPFRFMCKMSMPAKYGEGGWQFVWNTNTSELIQWDCIKCIYHDMFLRYGVPEMTTIFCERDDVIYGEISGAKWARTKTLGRGGELCDFRFIKNK